MARELQDQRSTTTALTMLGLFFLVLKDFAAAKLYFEQSSALCIELGQKWELMVASYGLGNIACGEGDFFLAPRLLAESISQARMIGAKWELSPPLVALAFVWLRQGQPKRAATLLGAEERLRESIRHKMWESHVPAYNR